MVVDRTAVGRHHAGIDFITYGTGSLALTTQANISIGALARATGVPANTLRTWERRYAFPTATRLPSGHRRYGTDQIDHIRWINRAIHIGHRPSYLTGMSTEEVRDLVQRSVIVPTRLPNTERTDRIHSWMEAVRTMDASALESLLFTAWSKHGAIAFLDDLIASFLVELGRSWADGELNIAQEHAATESVMAFLNNLWKPRSRFAEGPVIVLATLPDERHYLGLHLAATVLTLHDFQVKFIGPNTPGDALVEAARMSGASAVLVSVSQGAAASTVATHLRSLRNTLPTNIDLVVGGRGAPATMSHVIVMQSMAELDEWAASFRNLNRMSAGRTLSSQR